MGRPAHRQHPAQRSGESPLTNTAPRGAVTHPEGKPGFCLTLRPLCGRLHEKAGATVWGGEGTGAPRRQDSWVEPSPHQPVPAQHPRTPAPCECGGPGPSDMCRKPSAVIIVLTSQTEKRPVWPAQSVHRTERPVARTQSPGSGQGDTKLRVSELLRWLVVRPPHRNAASALDSPWQPGPRSAGPLLCDSDSTPAAASACFLDSCKSVRNTFWGQNTESFIFHYVPFTPHFLFGLNTPVSQRNNLQETHHPSLRHPRNQRGSEATWFPASWCETARRT